MTLYLQVRERGDAVHVGSGGGMAGQVHSLQAGSALYSWASQQTRLLGRSLHPLHCCPDLPPWPPCHPTRPLQRTDKAKHEEVVANLGIRPLEAELTARG
jgi:hypothetical protein